MFAAAPRSIPMMDSSLSSHPGVSQEGRPSIDPVHRVAEASLERLLGWFDRAPEISADPNDFKAGPWFASRLARKNSTLARIQLRAVYVPYGFFPRLMRRMNSIPRVQSAGAASWVARGYLELFLLMQQSASLELAGAWLRRLDGLRAGSTEAPAWGLPYDWQTDLLIPANSPLLYTTWQGAQANFDHFRVTGDKKSLEVCIAAMRGLHKHLNQLAGIPEQTAFSYSPFDRMEVYNTNALAGGLCCQAAAAAGDADLMAQGIRMLNWIAVGQHSDGSWEYFSRAYRGGPSAIDNFHSAMTLQGLIEGAQAARLDQWNASIRKGLRFYLDRFFDASGRPRFTPEKTYPTDVMSCAEGILIFTRILELSPPYLHDLCEEICIRLVRLVGWTCRNMQARSGHFYYQSYGWIRFSLESYRWGQGPMLKALAYYLRIAP
jgi:hypothetical protein